MIHFAVIVQYPFPVFDLVVEKYSSIVVAPFLINLAVVSSNQYTSISGRGTSCLLLDFHDDFQLSFGNNRVAWGLCGCVQSIGHSLSQKLAGKTP